MRPRLKKRLGQHHLVGGHLCGPLLDFLDPAGKRVVEIGPGGGVLTRELLDRDARVTAWELDLEWAFEARRLLGGEVSWVVGDAKALPWRKLPRGTLVAGNLPYNVATHLIRGLLRLGRCLPRCAFLVQLEVAERLAAGPGDASYGALSVLAATQARVTLLGRLRPGSFRPPPKVTSAFIGLESAEGALAEVEFDAFSQTVFDAFSQRRKTVSNSLAARWGKARAKQVLARTEIDPGTRAECLAPSDFRRLHSERMALEAPRGLGGPSANATI